MTSYIAVAVCWGVGVVGLTGLCSWTMHQKTPISSKHYSMSRIAECVRRISEENVNSLPR